ncbi:DUF1376 domain-containing protein [Pseudomonas viridiflava]|uniref:DUF1376 domain-containing protein n=1 Tax=Pseudomonas viridiflava TaxID=33069 RepID=UPI001C31DB34|nr:DUF1376 domain-containing protein [Pseudomonas viridiflava]QXG34015.1 DUF1376 domain-containing protein [Pseudomonas viridiflava]QXG42236.1 DUF1376 domain-containing protein [Pseudomonas viridiflava]
MAALPYMQLYVADYLADTMHLTTEEHGAYLLLIFNYWQTGKPIPVTRLARIARLSNERWTDVERSLNEFFNERDNEWVHDRIERDLEAVHATQSQRIAAGKASAEARKQAAKARKPKAVNERSTPVEISLNENATNIEEKRREEIRDTPPLYAQDVFDSRTKFSMHPDWLPCEKTFAAVLTMNAMANQQFDEGQLLEFKSFWIASPDEHRTQAKWEHALAQHLKRDLRNQQANGRSTDGNQNAELSGNAQNHQGRGSQDRNQRPARPGPLSAPDRVRAAIAERDALENAARQAVDQDG